jgi:glycosyltransferase involved in cell wall biosynthesis
MRICIDIQAAVAQRAGVGRYTKSLVEHLGEFTGQDQVDLFFFDFLRAGLPFNAPHTQPCPVRWLPGRVVQQAWKRFKAPPFQWLAGRADLYHFPNFTIPPLSGGRCVVTIHDMSFVRHPELAEARNLAYLNAVIPDTVRRADAILTVSRFSADEIVALLKVSPDRVFPVHLGVDPAVAAPPPDRLTATRHRLGLDRPYLLSVGTLEPRKNLPFLMDVFEHLRGWDGDLVIAGMPGWKCEPILERLRTSPAAARIRYLQYVAEEDLPALYAGAELFAITSVYEGFGLPPLEAMACGTPVVSSAGGSLPEVLGPAAMIIPGFEREAWTAAIEALLADPARRRAMAAAGVRHAAAFTWRETARRTFDVYRRVLS